MNSPRPGWRLAVCTASLWAAQVHALECPAPPVQANKDWETTVDAEVGKIGPVLGAKLHTRVAQATRDLMGKLPGADRVYLEQMMFASYCSALRDDKALSESAKAKQVLDYRRELRRSLAAVPAQTGAHRTP
jgi:uncharacterized protein